MKNISFLFFILFLFFNNSLSQTGWFSQSSPTTNDLRYIQFINQQTGWAVGFYYTIVKTTNGGSNWVTQYANTNQSFVSIFFINDQTGWASGGTLSLDISTITKTTNGGQNWNVIYSSDIGLVFRTIFVTQDFGYAVTSKGYILKTTNSGSIWNTIYSNTNFCFTQCYFLNQNTGWVIGDNGTILKTTDGGSNLLIQNSNTNLNLEGIYFTSANIGYIVGLSGKILKTTNSGQNWLSKSVNTSLWLNSIYFVDDNTGFIVGGDAYTENGKNINSVSGIFRTNDAGETWFPQNSPVSSSLTGVSFINSETGWIAGRNGVILKTTNGGMTLPAAPTLVYPPNQSVNIPLTPAMTWNIVVSASSYKVQISTVSNFSVITDSSTTIYTQYPVPIGKLQIGSTYFWRVYANTDLGPTPWSDIWYFSTVIVGIYSNNNNIPDNYKLYPNYPNPFNPTTKVKFDVPKQSYTGIIIYDVLGKQIEKAFEGNLNAGQYEFTWNASEMNSGVYFLRMIGDKFVETKRMLLIK